MATFWEKTRNLRKKGSEMAFGKVEKIGRGADVVTSYFGADLDIEGKVGKLSKGFIKKAYGKTPVEEGGKRKKMTVFEKALLLEQIEGENRGRRRKKWQKKQRQR